MTRKSQRGFLKNKSHQINLISSSDRITGLVNKGEADVIYPDCKKTAYSVLHDSLTSKLGACKRNGNINRITIIWAHKQEEKHFSKRPFEVRTQEPSFFIMFISN